jgi:hypothetical protein
MEIKYDTPIEVTENQYNFLINKFAGIIAFRKDAEGKYWIKLWIMQYKHILEKYLKMN